jgi:pimeloyl-ACP methyl ester carboxylesterase
MLYILALISIALATYVMFGGTHLPPDADAIIDDVLRSELPRVISGDIGTVSSNGAPIWYEDMAPVDSPRGTVLLNMSMAADALIWPPSFVRALTDAEYRVIRYDYRGTGMSDWMKDWDSKHPYTLADMADDAIAVLNERSVERAHLIGLSLGGMVAQEIAIRNPERVSSLTLMSTSGYAGDPNLPNLSMSYFLGSFVQGIPLLKYRLMGGEKNIIKERIGRVIDAGIEVDIQETAELVLYDLRKRKGINLRALLQHRAATDAGGSRYDKLKVLYVPTLVIHGENDDTVPLAAVLDWARPQELPVVVVPGAEHFFHRKLHILKRIVHANWR